MTKAEIIKGCLKNERKSQYELYRMCYEKYMATCERYQTDKLEAESALNESYMKIINHLHRYSAEFSFDAWCKRIIINTNIDIYRRKKKRNTIQITENGKYVNDANPASLYDHQEFGMEELMAMVKNLPSLQGKVFNLFAIDGYGHKEIANMLEISEGSSKWYLHDARKKLMKHIALKRKVKNSAYGK